jgi:superfamily II RNA helicase
MATSLAKYYMDELVDWNRAIASYLEELNEFEIKLGEVIQRNTIPNIAAKVEEQQNKLNQVSGKFHSLPGLIQQQKIMLKTDNAFIEDALLTAETEKQQNELRRIMQQTEKEYIEKKHECNNFLSGTMKK